MKRLLSILVLIPISLVILSCSAVYYPSVGPPPWDYGVETPTTYSPADVAPVQPHPQGHPDLSLTHIEEVKYYGGKYGVDPVFLLALMQSESSGRPGAVSSRRAYGLLQITLPTARDYDPEATPARLLDSDYNLEIACRHYRWLRDRIDRYFGHTGEYQRLRITVAAWNAGLQAVLDHGGIPHYPESQLLLSRFEEKYLEYIALGY